MSELLESVIEAHGGAGRFQSAQDVELDIESGGLAFAMRFRRPPARYTAHVSTTEPRTVISAWPDEDRRGVFERDSVRVESASGEVLARRDDPRADFGKLRRKLWWDELDLLYFAGYALWNYVNTPFMFLRPGFELDEIEPWSEDGERWRRLRVRFPPDIPTHSREQEFYFDEGGRLRRLDYTAEVFGSWAKAAHYCHDHQEFDGLLVPTRRRVYPRKPDNRPRPRPTLVRLDIRDVTLAQPHGAPAH